MADAIKVHVYDDATLLGTVNVSGGNWSKTGQSLAAGVHKIKGRAEDLAGNIGSFSSIKNVYTGSATTPTCDLLDDSGESSSDNVTNDDTPRIKVILNLGSELTALSPVGVLPWQAVKALKLQKSIDGGTNWTDVDTHTVVEGDKIDDAIWEYSFQITSALSNGVVKFRALWQDQKNNWSAVGAVLDVTIDITAPSAPAITNIYDGQVFIGTSIDISGTAS